MFPTHLRSQRSPSFGVLICLVIAGNACIAEGADAKGAKSAADRPAKTQAVPTPTYPTPAPSTNIAPVAASGFMETNGNKFIAAAGALHAVFTENYEVKYAKSANGLTWSTPVTLATYGHHPVIAAVGNTIGVAYVHGGGNLQYISKSAPNAGWSLPVNIHTIGHSRQPSMVSYQSRMHLVWAVGDSGQPATAVRYVSIPPVITASPPAASIEPVNPILLCIGVSYSIFLPTIAVSATSATDPQPLKRIAYFVRTDTTSTNCGTTGYDFSFMVVERQQPHWTPIFHGGGFSTGNPLPISMSMAASPTKGDFYLGLSYENNGAGATLLLHQNGWKSSGWSSFTVGIFRAHIDVEASCDKFRVAISELNNPLIAPGFGSTGYRTGTWTGPTPVWIDPKWNSSSGNGGNVQALFLSRYSGTRTGGTTHYFNSAFDQIMGTTPKTFFLKHEHRTVNGPPVLSPCNDVKSTVGGKAF